MKFFLFIFTLATVLAGLSVGQVKAAENRELSEYRWQNRILLVFAPSADFPAYRRYVQEIEGQRQGIQERDLLILRILEQGQSFRGGALLRPEAAASLVQRFGVRRGETRVVLIGKDGGVKLDRAALVPMAEIFGLIDSMPMRRQELKEKR
jgi:hypothetical protein